MAQVTWMNAQLRQRFRVFQNSYGKKMPGVALRTASAAGFSRTMSLSEYSRTTSSGSGGSTSETTPQRAHSLESSPAAAAGACFRRIPSTSISRTSSTMSRTSSTTPLVRFFVPPQRVSPIARVLRGWRQHPNRNLRVLTVVTRRFKASEKM